MEEDIQRAAHAALRRYARYPNVVGVAAGTKYTRGAPRRLISVQFFVTHKTGRASPRLPAYVCARHSDGRVNRKRRFPTDVIAVGSPQLAYAAGSRIEGVGRQGTVTLVFRNRLPDMAGSYYLLTCAHLAGDLTESPPAAPFLCSPDYPQVAHFARVIKCGARRGKTVEYDLALAELTDEAVAAAGSAALASMDGQVLGSGTRLRAFLPLGEIRPALAVECRLAESGERSGRVRSFPGTVLVRIGASQTWIHNACLIDVPVCAGDSGGIVYDGDTAVGVVFARSSRGWAWFHPLEPAFAYLESIEPFFALRCFS